MRVISGTARGITLKTIEGIKTRPTTDRVKEAIFSSIQFNIRDARCLDAFAGSGALGIEALSRGAHHVDFIDISKACCKIIHENLKRTYLEEKARIINQPISALLQEKHGCDIKYDLVFLDPPYGKGLIDAIINMLVHHDMLDKSAIIIVEHNHGEDIQESYGIFSKSKEKKYGNTYITTFRSTI